MLAAAPAAAVPPTKASLAKFVTNYYNDPLGFVWAVYPWGKKGTILERETGPDVWQTAVLEELGKQLKLRLLTPEEQQRAIGKVLSAVIRLAVASGNGPGKTTLAAWIIYWFISTRPNPQIVVTAN